MGKKASFCLISTFILAFVFPRLKSYRGRREHFQLPTYVLAAARAKEERVSWWEEAQERFGFWDLKWWRLSNLCRKHWRWELCFIVVLLLTLLARSKLMTSEGITYFHGSLNKKQLLLIYRPGTVLVPSSMWFLLKNRSPSLFVLSTDQWFWTMCCKETVHLRQYDI